MLESLETKIMGWLNLIFLLKSAGLQSVLRTGLYEVPYSPEAGGGGGGGV